MSRTRLSKAIVSQVGTFVQTLGSACPKPSVKFLYYTTLGMAISGSVLLSEVGRKLLGVRAITFHALHKGLCRGLKSKQWGALAVHERYLKKAASVLPSNTIVACDLGDITKPRARKMPGLRTVRDGSTKTLKKGWWLVEIEAIIGKKKKHLPLWLELFSVGRNRYKSQRAMMEMAISTIVRHVGKLGLWVFDRGFDNWQFFAFLAGLTLRFLIRVNSNRMVIDLSDGKRKSMGALARSAAVSAKFLWGRRRRGRYLIQVAFARFRIPQNDQELTLIVARGFGKKPLLLVTNEPVADGTVAAKFAKAYLKRWGVEEAGRLQKQVFDLENLRVLSWAGLVKLVWLTMWTYGLLCLIRLRANKLYERILAIYPSFGKTPRFPYYRVAGGLALLLLVGTLTDPTLLLAGGKSG
jgi:hypothetical protein